MNRGILISQLFGLSRLSSSVSIICTDAMSYDEVTISTMDSPIEQIVHSAIVVRIFSGSLHPLQPPNPLHLHLPPPHPRTRFRCRCKPVPHLHPECLLSMSRNLIQASHLP